MVLRNLHPLGKKRARLLFAGLALTNKFFVKIEKGNLLGRMIFAPFFPTPKVVKDARARRNDEASLNSCVHQGPNLLSNILKVILCFIKERIDT